MTVVAEHELYRACKIIFGPDLTVSRKFLGYLQKSGVKRAYRKRVLETHPDRCVGRGELARRRHVVMFHSLQQAYENLNNYLIAREKGYCLETSKSGGGNGKSPFTRVYKWKTGSQVRKRQKQEPSAGSRSAASDREKPAWEKKQNVGSFSHIRSFEKKYRGTIPARKLRIGHYLYFSGMISWESLIKALVWQRRQRPRLGEIGRSLGWLRSRDIRKILSNRTFPTPFGRTAVQLGLLSESQLASLLSRQNRMKKKIGVYFVRHNLLTSTQMTEFVSQCRKHNSRQRYSAVSRF
ncbi:MAG: J domain-containing protein [Thermodesulfobacteriota bacterium]|nr:J domain-containing protein [Thermodesulfobacteriota bacterium]